MRPVFSVHLLLVNRGDKEAAITAIRQALEELHLTPPFHSRQVFTADLTWLTIQGFGIGGVHFRKRLLEQQHVTLRPKITQRAKELAHGLEVMTNFLRSLQPPENPS